MKMILAIIQDEDVDGLLDAMAQSNLRATKVSSTGGFLRSGNSTILIGAEDAQVTRILDIIRATCRTRMQPLTILPAEGGGMVNMTEPLDVEVGGANVFVWDVQQHVRI